MRSRLAMSTVVAAALALVPAAAATPQERVVTTTADGSDGRCDAHCTLREAVALSTGDEVVILPAGRYELTQGELELGSSKTILGDGARTTIVDAADRSRVLRATGVENVVSGVTITGGAAYRRGGGIHVDVGGRLALEDSSVVDNVAGRKGGGIFNAGGLKLVQSTVAGNRAGHATTGLPGRGAGIYSAAGGHASLENSTISGNTADPGDLPSRGGGVLSAGDLASNHVTIAGNSASDGGGLYQSSPARSMSNTILAGNRGGACSGETAIVDEHGNLDDDGTCELGSIPQPGPLVGPLANNGGETDTHALLPGSPAIDAGSRASCAPQDQRHVVRDAACDIGAFEAKAPVPVLLDGTPLDLYSDGAGRLQVRIEGQSGIFAAPDDNAADAGLAIKQGGVHYGLGVGRTVISAPRVTQLGSSRVMSSQYAVGANLRVTERIEYDDGSDVIGMRYEIHSTSGAPVTFRAGALGDLSVAGDDTGTGIFLAGAPRFVGGRSRDGATAGLVERTPWLGYEAGDVAGVFGNFAADGLTNTVVPDVVDNAVGVEWERTVEPGQPAVLEVSWRVNAAPARAHGVPPGAAGGAGSPLRAEQPEQLPPPVAGKTVNILPVRGTVRIKLPGTRRFVELEEGRQIPLGTVVDTLAGRATLVAASDKSGGTATADFYRGIFRLGQTKGAKPLTTLKLTERLRCGRGEAGAAAKRKRKRRLWGDGSGRFRTDGRYSSATVRGTKWLVEDRCASTLTRAVEGRVAVRDKVKRKTVIVRAGKRYVAKRGS